MNFHTDPGFHDSRKRKILKTLWGKGEKAGLDVQGSHDSMDCHIKMDFYGSIII